MNKEQIFKKIFMLIIITSCLYGCTMGDEEEGNVNTLVKNGMLVIGSDAVIDDPGINEQKEVTIATKNNILKPVTNDSIENLWTSSAIAELRENLTKLNEDMLHALGFEQTKKEKMEFLLNNSTLNVEKFATPQQLSNLTEYIKGASAGKVEYQNKLADFYLDGFGGDSYEELAVSWYLLAAKNNSPYAQYMLSILYKTGIGVEQNLDEALKWYKEAAASKYSTGAKYRIAKRYLSPNSLLHDEAKAIEWLEAAAKIGDIEAQCLLADLYIQGRGVIKSPKEALNWYGKAASFGSAYAAYSLGAMYYNGEGVEQNLQEANKWLTKAAFKNNHQAQYLLGKMYEEGFGVKKSLVAAYAWWQLIPQESIMADGFRYKLNKIMAAMTAQELAEAQNLSAQYKKRLTS